jgi:hypothetical protein
VKKAGGRSAQAKLATNKEKLRLYGLVTERNFDAHKDRSDKKKRKKKGKSARRQATAQDTATGVVSRRRAHVLRTLNSSRPPMPAGVVVDGTIQICCAPEAEAFVHAICCAHEAEAFVQHAIGCSDS